MSKIDEVITGIDGKMAFAQSTGNKQAESELVDIRNLLCDFKKHKECESLCNTCTKGELGNCFYKPTTVINRKVIRCNTYRKERQDEIQGLISTR